MELALGWLIWAALKPIVKLAILLSLGAYSARIKLITPVTSKVLTKFLLLFPYPCLFFTSIVNSIKPESMEKMGILLFMSVAFLFIGHAVGILLCRFLQPKRSFQNTLVMACSMGNYGDLPMAIILSIGNSEPFQNGDQEMGIAYISVFLVLTNLYFFIVGLASIGKDIQVLIEEEREKELVELDPPCTSRVVIQVLHQRSTSASAELARSDVRNEIQVENEGVDEYRMSRKSLFGKWKSSSSLQKDLSWKELMKSTREYLASPAAQLWIQCVFSPCNIAILLGLLVTLTPSLKSLFVISPPAISIQEQPIFSFIMETMILVSNCSVVLGIVNLGAALGALEVDQFLGWKIVGSIAFSRLLIIPTISILFTLLIQWVTNWIPRSDVMLRFVIMLEAVVPTASSTVYFTQYWHPRGEAQGISGVLLVQYMICGVTLTISLITILSML